MRLSRLLLTLLVPLALLAAACGDDDDATTGSGSATAPADDSAGDDATDDAGDAAAFPVTIESDGGTWTLESAPERIVSLSPTATEVLFAIGAGDQVIAADEYSTYPEEAPDTDLSGFDPNVEAVVGYDPDLVVIANDANDLIEALTELEIPVLVSAAPADIESGYDTMAELGIATGHVDETAELVAELRSEIEALLAEAPTVPVRIYHELGDAYYSASSFGFVGSVYTALGATNIADEADADATGYPQLTEEYIVDADPEVIVITDQNGYTADDVAARPGWEEVSAVSNGNIVTVNADIASRWGPRLPEFIEAVVEALSAVQASA